jgi:hypothetical protein
MTTENPVAALPLDPLLALGADVGATCDPHAAMLVISPPREHASSRDRLAPLNLADLGSEIEDVVVVRQPRGVADLSDIRHALGAQAVRALFEHRREAGKIESSRRDGPELKDEKNLANTSRAWREVARASDDLALFEGQVAGETQAHLSVGEAVDARDATMDGERRSFLRSMPDAGARLEAMRADPALLQAALRAPRLAGVTDAAERDLMQSAWQRIRDAADPTTAARIAEGSERCRWARTAINSAAKVLAKETTTPAEQILRALDVTDCDRLSRLVEVNGANKFEPRRAA